MTYFLNDSTAHFRRLFLNRGASIGSSQAFRFADGERGYRLAEDVKRANVALVGSVLPDPESLFDILATFRLLRDNRSKVPHIIIPYLGYAGQDRAEAGESATGVMVAELLRNLNPASVHAVDVHSPQVFDALGPQAVSSTALPVLAERLAKGGAVDVVVAPDAGARRRAEELARLLSVPQTAYVEKERPKPGVAIAKALHGDVRGARVVIIDDIIDTGGTIIEAVKMLSRAGASEIRVAATHGVFSGNAREKLERLPVQEILVTNSLPQPRSGFVKSVDISSLLMNLASHVPPNR